MSTVTREPSGTPVHTSGSPSATPSREEVTTKTGRTSLSQQAQQNQSYLSLDQRVLTNLSDERKGPQGSEIQEQKEQSPPPSPKALNFQPLDLIKEEALDELALQAAEKGDVDTFSERLNLCEEENTRIALLAQAGLIAAQTGNTEFIFAITSSITPTQRLHVFTRALCQINTKISDKERTGLLDSLKEGCLRTSEAVNTLRWAIAECAKYGRWKIVEDLMLGEKNEDEKISLIKNVIAGAAAGKHNLVVHKKIREAPTNTMREKYIQHAVRGAAKGNNLPLIKELIGSSNWSWQHSVATLIGAAKSCNVSLIRLALQNGPSKEYAKIASYLGLDKGSPYISDEEYDSFLIQLSQEEPRACALPDIGFRAGRFGNHTLLCKILSFLPYEQRHKPSKKQSLFINIKEGVKRQGSNGARSLVIVRALAAAILYKQDQFIHQIFQGMSETVHHQLRKKALLEAFKAPVGKEHAYSFIRGTNSKEAYHLCKLVLEGETLGTDLIPGIVNACPKEYRMKLREIVIEDLNRQKNGIISKSSKKQKKRRAPLEQRIEAVINTAPNEKAKEFLRKKLNSSCVIM